LAAAFICSCQVLSSALKSLSESPADCRAAVIFLMALFFSSSTSFSHSFFSELLLSFLITGGEFLDGLSLPLVLLSDWSVKFQLISSGLSKSYPHFLSLPICLIAAFSFSSCSFELSIFQPL
jgi:hypothetical protein